MAILKDHVYTVLTRRVRLCDDGDACFKLSHWGQKYLVIYAEASYPGLNDEGEEIHIPAIIDDLPVFDTLAEAEQAIVEAGGAVFMGVWVAGGPEELEVIDDEEIIEPDPEPEFDLDTAWASRKLPAMQPPL